MTEMRLPSELTAQHLTGRLTGAIGRLRAGTANPAITWGMMSALAGAYAEHQLSTGPHAARLLEELRALCGAPPLDLS
ncbi:hypothetical protein ACFFMN_42570 [Planobispora siamensis]|nr:hypothetical protein [Planobispora siamensis]